MLLLNRCTRTTLRSNSNSGLFAEYRFALTRRIDPSLAKNALRIGGSDVGEIDMTAALDQHQKLVGAMQSIGLQIFELSSDGCADSVFIEDTVVIVGKTAMITNPGAVSRRAETVGVKRFLETSQDFLLQVIQQSEGQLDGGDVLFTGYIDTIRKVAILRKLRSFCSFFEYRLLCFYR
jgi:N-dimethylarginine dimethylaminohydrolase